LILLQLINISIFWYEDWLTKARTKKKENKMVIGLLFLTVAVFLIIDYFLSREDLKVSEYEKKPGAAIFMRPEKSLVPVKVSSNRMFHPSHTWSQSGHEKEIIIGFDEIIPFIFSDQVELENLPVLNQTIHQGDVIWQIKASNKTLSQKSPVSGLVTEINPACSSAVPVPSSQLSNSWILKVKTDTEKRDGFNLLPLQYASGLLQIQKDRLTEMLHGQAIFNDGGRLDPALIRKLDDDTWNSLSELVGLSA